MKQKQAIIFDLDGTLADVEHRRHFIRPEPGRRYTYIGKEPLSDMEGKEIPAPTEVEVFKNYGHKALIVKHDDLPRTEIVIAAKDLDFKPDWDAFNAACVDDKPIESVIWLAQLIADGAARMRNFRSRNVEIIILSGRGVEVLMETREWLRKHQVPYNQLCMRPRRDYTPDPILKERWLESLKRDGYEIAMVFDDRDSVVSMWRQKGLRCLQVAPGDF